MKTTLAPSDISQESHWIFLNCWSCKVRWQLYLCARLLPFDSREHQRCQELHLCLYSGSAVHSLHRFTMFPELPLSSPSMPAPWTFLCSTCLCDIHRESTSWPPSHHGYWIPCFFLCLLSPTGYPVTTSSLMGLCHRATTRCSLATLYPLSLPEQKAMEEYISKSLH